MRCILHHYAVFCVVKCTVLYHTAFIVINDKKRSKNVSAVLSSSKVIGCNTKTKDKPGNHKEQIGNTGNTPAEQQERHV